MSVSLTCFPTAKVDKLKVAPHNLTSDEIEGKVTKVQVREGLKAQSATRTVA
jgi:hypothetical protein